MPQFSRRIVLALAGAVCSMPALVAAQAPIKLNVGFPPGTGPDRVGWDRARRSRILALGAADTDRPQR